MSGIALAITVKNERDLLRSNVLYHRYLGVKSSYIFLDNTTDDTQDTVSDLDYVTVSDSVTGDRFLETAERRQACVHSVRLRETVEKSAENHDARQVLNAYVAWEQARDAGMEWLVSLDADELVWPGSASLVEGQLANEFDGLGKHIEQVRFVPLEVIPRRRQYENVFHEAVHFKRHGSKVRQDLYDPLTGRSHKFEFVPTRLFPARLHGIGLYKVRRFTWWYGHHRGKWAVRIGPTIVPLIHRCVKLDGSGLVTEAKFHLLHYIIYNHEDFVKKYRKFADRADVAIGGAALQYRKRFWRDLVNNSALSDSALGDYYKQWIAFGEEDILRLQQKHDHKGASSVVEVTAVREVFEKLSRGYSE